MIPHDRRQWPRGRGARRVDPRLDQGGLRAGVRLEERDRDHGRGRSRGGRTGGRRRSAGRAAGRREEEPRRRLPPRRRRGPGAPIMGDGRVALILDVGSLVRRSRH